MVLKFIRKKKKKVSLSLFINWTFKNTVDRKTDALIQILNKRHTKNITGVFDVVPTFGMN